MHNVKGTNMNTFAAYRCRGGVDSTQPMFSTSSLKFMIVPIFTIVANGSGQDTDSVFSTPNIWKRVTNWVQTMVPASHARRRSTRTREEPVR